MKVRTGLIVAGMLWLTGGGAFGADPVMYDVMVKRSGNASLDALLKQSSSLLTLQKTLPPAPFALIGRAKADSDQAITVMHSLGFDAGQVDITIDGMKLDDPGLLDHLSALPNPQHAQVLVTPHPGAVFRIGKLNLVGVPLGRDLPLGIKSGDIALAAPILAQPQIIQTALKNEGYAFANVSLPLAIAQIAEHRLDISYTITPGPRVAIGAISFRGLTRTNADFLRRHIKLQPGQDFSQTNLNAAQASLLSLGVFTSVTPEVKAPNTPGAPAPILFRVVQQKRHSVSLSGSYATDTGFTLGTSWEDRDMFRHAETLTFTVAANGVGGTGATAPGYDLKGIFAKPDFGQRGQTLALTLEAINQSLTAYHRTAALGAFAITRPLTPNINFVYGPEFITESVTQEHKARDYTLLEAPTSLIFSSVDDPLEPVHGVYAAASLTPSLPPFGKAQPFLIALVSASTYLNVEANGRGIIAVHCQIGSILGAPLKGVPADQRFYAGGSGSVRGYTYQTIGLLLPDDKPQGGLAIDTASLEFRQRIMGNFGIVPFVDIGQVSAGSGPFKGRLRVGAGLGFRYYTGIGPIRLDIAVPLSRVAGSGGFALYIGLGEAF